MTIGKILSQIDAIKPNQYTQDEKVRWLSELDAEIFDTITKTNKTDAFTPYNPSSETITSQELLVPDDYAKVYLSYLSSKIDFWNGEYTRYNNSAVLYNNDLLSFANYWTRNHLPAQNVRTKAK